MLSRIADSLFWIARYMERAEDTARILDVNYHMLLEGAQQPDRLRWEPLSASAGAHERFFEPLRRGGRRARSSTSSASAHDNPDSIVQCFARARENARTIRDRISREMWEDLNSLYLEVSRLPASTRSSPTGPHRFCNLVKSGSHRFLGVSRATLPRDEGWHFLQAGRALERAEMTARIVDVQYHTLLEGRPAASDRQPPVDGGAQVGRGLRVLPPHYNTRIEPERVAELLVLHPQHPRSIRFNIGVLQSALRAISGSGPTPTPTRPSGSRAGCTTASSTTASRTSSRAGCTLPAEVQRTCRPSASISRARTSTTRWAHEPLRLLHVTDFDYDGPVSESYNEVHLQPRRRRAAELRRFRLRTHPAVVAHRVARLLRQLGAPLQRAAASTAACASRPSRW